MEANKWRTVHNLRLSWEASGESNGEPVESQVEKKMKSQIKNPMGKQRSLKENEINWIIEVQSVKFNY